MVKFHRTRLSRIEQRLQPVKPKRLDTSKCGELVSALARAQGTDGYEAALHEWATEIRRLFHPTFEQCNDEGVSEFFRWLGKRDSRTSRRN